MSGTMECATIKSEEQEASAELRACRGCLATDVPLIDLRSQGLAQIFGDLTGIPVLPTDIYPQLVCMTCKHLLSKFCAFRIRCHSSMYVIQQMVQAGAKVSTELLSTVDKSILKQNLIARNIHVSGLDDSKEAITDGVDTLANVTPTHTVNNTYLLYKKSGDVLVYDRQIKVENIDITTAKIKDSDDIYNNVSVVLNKSDEWQSDTEINASELPIKHEELSDSGDNDNNDSSVLNESDDESVIESNASKLPIKCEKIEISHDNDHDASSVLNETDKVQSDTEINAIKLPKKRNRVNKENVNCKKPRKPKRTVKKETEDKIEIEGEIDEQDILKGIGNLLRSAWMVSRDGSYTSLWDQVHEESLKDEHEPMDFKDFTKWTLTQKINQYIYLSKKLAKLYNSEVKFSCLADEKKEIEDRRSSEKYLKAPFKCELCCRNYSFEDTYKRHMVSHDPRSGDIVCEVCFYRFKNRSRCVKHYRKCHTKKIVCNTCGFINREWNNAKTHFKWHGGADTVCEQCGKHFSEKKVYLMHVRSMHRAELATTLCLLCGDTYNGPTGLNVHMQRTHKECERCPTCNTQFASADALATHLALSDKDNSCHGLSACPMCGNNFPSEHSMREHYDQLHKKEFKCEQCGRVLDTLTQYTRHLKPCLARRMRIRDKKQQMGPSMPRKKGKATVRGENVFMCEQCGKKNFKCFATLRNHQRVHTGEKPYKCEHCEKSFRERQLLKVHMTTHTDERRYKCPLCPKAFRQLPHRDTHIRTHTKERPYKCNACSKCYSGATALREHVDTAHKGLPARQRGKNKEKNCKNIKKS